VPSLGRVQECVPLLVEAGGRETKRAAVFDEKPWEEMAGDMDAGRVSNRPDER